MKTANVCQQDYEKDGPWILLVTVSPTVSASGFCASLTILAGSAWWLIPLCQGIAWRGNRARLLVNIAGQHPLSGVNGTEMTSNAIRRWQEGHKVSWCYIAAGKAHAGYIRGKL